MGNKIEPTREGIVQNGLVQIGLAMTGGGARGAYQAGVLKRIGEIKNLQGKKCPFDVIGAASAGAVNGAALAAGSHDFSKNTDWLAQLWSGLSTKDIYRSDYGSLLPKAGKWIKDLSLGPFFGGGQGLSLLDASPLRDLLAKNLNTDLIQNNLDRGNLKALTIAATNYTTGKTYLFVQGVDQRHLWAKRRQIALQTKITVDHICASSAIPIVFSPVKLTTTEGIDYFGDGCLRLTTPLSPIIRLKVNRIMAIGVRTQNTVFPKKEKEDDIPSLAQVLGTALNAIFMDHLDTDVDHLNRLNNIIVKSKIDSETLSSMEGGIQIVKTLSITPSVDLGRMAESFADRLPGPVRYLMSGLGSVRSSSDLMSYLLFDSSFTKALIHTGYQDAKARIDEIEDFLFIV